MPPPHPLRCAPATSAPATLPAPGRSFAQAQGPGVDVKRVWAAGFNRVLRARRRRPQPPVLRFAGTA